MANEGRFTEEELKLRAAHAAALQEFRDRQQNELVDFVAAQTAERELLRKEKHRK